MKLKWVTTNGKVWEADFMEGLLTLRIDFERDRYGIYDTDEPVWQEEVHGKPYWEDLAEKTEAQLQMRLIKVSQTLDETWLKPTPSEFCDQCGEHSEDLHPGFAAGDQRRCPPCVCEFTEAVAEQCGLRKRTETETDAIIEKFYKEAGNCMIQLPSLPFQPELYWVEKPFRPEYEIKLLPSTQVEDAIKEEAETVKL